jgi:hypothetical protein
MRSMVPAGPALQAAHATFPEGAEMLGGTLKVGAVAAAALERFSTSLTWCRRQATGVEDSRRGRFSDD